MKEENQMKKLIFMICLPALVLAGGTNCLAATVPAPEYMKVQMIGEITRGSNEVFNCSNGLTYDGEIANCLNRVLDENIQNDKDSAEFLLGAYFMGFARLASSNPAEKVKDKWLETCFNRFSEIEKYLGFNDKEIAEITGTKSALPEIEKMRMKGKN